MWSCLFLKKGGLKNLGCLFSSNDCVAALATPALKSGLGVIRISGEGAIEKISKIFKPGRIDSLTKMKGYEAAYGFIVDLKGNRIDDAVAVVFREPHSYTGEDVVELSCHGGPVILNLVLEMCFNVGCKPALNGEFTKRAFLNGKLSLTQAEAVYDVINADSTLSLKAANSVKNGFLFKKTQGVCEKLIEMNAHLEAYLNYPDEGVEEPEISKLVIQIDSAIETLKVLVSNFRVSRNLKNGIKTVLIGEPNVGKSTLMNLLTGQNSSIVTEISGTTRDVVRCDVEIGEIKFTLSDTAGFRQSTDEIEKEGIARARHEFANADLILMVVDGSKSFLNEIFYEVMAVKNSLKICVLNKIDLGSFEFDSKKLDFDVFIKTSNKNLQSILGLKKAMVNLVKSKLLNRSSLSTVFFVNERQNRALNQAINELKEAKKTLQAGMGFDAVSSVIEAAIDKILELNGKKVSDELINKIFSKFCVGK